MLAESSDNLAKISPSISTDGNPRLAIVIPLYNMRSRYNNDEEFIAIMSHYNDLAKEHAGKIEFHLVDDGSKDGSDQLMREFEAGDCWLFVHYLAKNAKKIGAIKHVINNLPPNFRFVMHTDFDCRFSPDAIDNALRRTEQLDTHPKWGGFGLRVTVERVDNALEIFQEMEYAMGRFSYFLLKYEGRVRCVGGAGGLWKREVYETQLENHSGMFISEDMEMTALIMHAGYQVHYAKDVVLYTKTPNTLRSLIKQRIRWAKGALYCYHNVDKFYTGQAMLFLPRLSLHGLMTGYQMLSFSMIPCWIMFTLHRLLVGDYHTAIRIYVAGLIVDLVLALASFKEIDHHKKCYRVLPLAPIIEYVVVFFANTAAYYQFIQERFKDSGLQDRVLARCLAIAEQAKLIEFGKWLTEQSRIREATAWVKENHERILDETAERILGFGDEALRPQNISKRTKMLELVAQRVLG